MKRDRILIVEPEREACARLRALLSRRTPGYDLRSAPTPRRAREELRTFRPHAALIDIDLGPRAEGLTLCKEIRADPAIRHAGVIMLSRRLVQGEEHRALLHGADLCLLERTFLSPMVRENVRALLKTVRRRSGCKITRGPLVLCTQDKVAWIGERPMDLTAEQFELLLRMVRQPGQTLSPTTLLGYDDGPVFADPPTVARVQVCLVRREMGEYASMIQTVRGKGYRLVVAGESP